MMRYRRTLIVLLLVATATIAIFSGTTAATNGYCAEQNATTVVGSGSYEGLETQYCEAADDLDETESDLNGTITAIEQGDGDLESANETLTLLKSQHDTLKERESAVVGQLVEETSSGEVAGGFGTMQAVSADSEHRTESVATTADSYQTTLETHRGGPQLTVQLSLFGSIAVGVVIGLLAGAVAPIYKARSIKEKIKYTSDVSYDKKVVLLPAIIGVVLAVSGVVLLYQFIGINDLIVVIR